MQLVRVIAMYKTLELENLTWRPLNWVCLSNIEFFPGTHRKNLARGHWENYISISFHI